MTPRPQPGPNPDDPEPWLGYIRVSTWREEQISPELQRASIEDWARRTGARIVDWIVDLDVSGRTFKRKIMGAIERVERGEARGITVWRYSRFGRDRTGNALNLARLEAAGGRLESATEPIDAGTASGEFQREMIFAFGNFESNRAGEQWRETHDHRRHKLRLPATGRPRFGYIWHPRRVPDGHGGWTLQEERYEADEELGPIVAKLYRHHVDGAPFYELCSRLNANGYRTVRGGLWAIQTLIRYMDSGFPAGLLRLHDPRCKCAPETRGTCRNCLYAPGAHEELISADLWQQYQERRRVVQSTPPRARTALYSLTGLARCGGCRGTATLSAARRKGPDGETHSVRGHAYQCGRRGVTGTHGCEGVWIHRALVEKAVLGWLAREAAPGIDAAPSVPQQRVEAADVRARAARERARLQAEIDKLAAGLTRLRADHAVNPDDYGPGEYEAARDRIKQQRQVAQAALEKVAVVEAIPDRSDYEPLMVGLMQEWSTLLVGERNALLRQLVRRVVLARHGSGQGNVEVQVHPVWEPDPWAQQVEGAPAE